MAERIVTSIVFWTLWAIGLIGQLIVIHDVFISQSMSQSQQLFAITFFTLLPISYGLWKERQVV